jgi:hypothetical protein
MELKRFIDLIFIKFKCDQSTIQHKLRKGLVTMQMIIYDLQFYARFPPVFMRIHNNDIVFQCLLMVHNIC